MKFVAKSFDELTASEIYEILKARAKIFLLEQGIVCQDMDDVDYDSIHCYLEDDGRISAYLRAYPADDGDSVTIGRVLTLQHKNGTGRLLMSKSIEKVKQHFGVRTIAVHAQKQAVGFYEKMGFHIVSKEYLEEGIPHIDMEMNLK